MTQYRIVPAEDGAQYVWMETKIWYIPFSQKSRMRIETDGVTTDGIKDEKAKKALYREIKIQDEPETLKIDRFLIPSDKLAECDCN
jgi:hypothetical protein